MENEKIYLGGGFEEYQHIWLLPIINKFCEYKNISEVIFEKKILNYNNKITYTDVKNYSFSQFKYINYLISFFKNIKKIIKITLFLNRNIILNNRYKKNDWLEYQVIHSIWDTSIRFSKDGTIEPNYLIKFFSALIVYKFLDEAEFLVRSKIKYVFMGHSVYYSRAQIAYFQKKKITIFVQAGCSFYKIKKNNYWNIFDIKFIKKIKNIVEEKKVKSYWLKRKKGKGDYEDSRIAANLSTKNIKCSEKLNVIFLHIFRDSPFGIIDSSRIYSDYIEWIYETFKIISETKDTWLIKFHPSSKKWGENSQIYIDKICNQIPNFNINKNIIFDKKTSNHHIFLNSKKIVTFSGTSHLEAACYGIKPICISKATLTSYKKICFKPNSRIKYKELILEKNTDKFSLNKEDISLSRFLLYIREKVVKIDKSIGFTNIYINDSNKKKIEQIKKVKVNLEKNLVYLNKLSFLFHKLETHTVSKDYIYKFFK